MTITILKYARGATAMPQATMDQPAIEMRSGCLGETRTALDTYVRTILALRRQNRD